MVRKIVGAFCLVMAAGGFAGAAVSQGDSVVASIIIGIIFFAAGAALFFGKGRPKEEKAALKAQKQEAKERYGRTLGCWHVSGLRLGWDCICTVRFDEEEIVISGGESTIRVPFKKCVSLKIEHKSNVERYYGYSIPGALIGGAALGPAGAGLLGVKRKKRIRVTDHLVIAYNSAENRVDSLVFRLPDGTSIKANRLVKRYLPRCGGQGVDITL